MIGCIMLYRILVSNVVYPRLKYISIPVDVDIPVDAKISVVGVEVEDESTLRLRLRLLTPGEGHPALILSKGTG